jgi:hypothetical protein
MLDEIFDYLLEFGFTKEDLRRFEDENSEMFEVDLKVVKDNIEFLFNKKLTKEEIIEVIKNDPFMLTDKKNRRDYYDKLYIKVLNLTEEEIKSLIKSNNDVYSASPVELEKIINYLSSKNKDVKKMILSYPKIITMRLDDIKNIM